MRFPPETHYARSGDVHIAYQTVGEGPIDLVFVMGWVSHLDYFWNEPRFARFLTRLASISRLILFDKRGTGLSDRVQGLPTLEERADDVRAVLDAVGSERAALFGVSEGAVLCAQYAATYPERVSSLIIFGGYARRLEAPDYPWGGSRAVWEEFVAGVETEWGVDSHLSYRAPSLANDPAFRDWWTTYLRMSASPGAAAALTRMNSEIDICAVLPVISVPTLVLHRVGDQAITVGSGRYLAANIPGAKYVELPGDDHLPFVGDQEEILREVELFLTGELPAPEPDRILATLLQTGIVEGAVMAARLGDRAWGELLAQHDALVREEVARFRGKEIRQTPGGFVATFDGPARAIRCAQSILARARDLGITVRAGLHAGECLVVGTDLSGIAVQIVERIFARATPNEVLTSSTIRDLVAGSGIEFEELPGRLLTASSSSMVLYRLVLDAPALTAHASPPPIAEEFSRPPSILSPREREVAILVARGYTNRDVAERLSIAPATVERHVANILGKLGFHTRAQVAAWAVVHDLLRFEVS